ncbi:tetratricopeptide repeat protein [Methylobacterium nodulans]|uniref:tetratricopeptide repeat protein n=1 Tax=Methylobacterium nodulans TaxID=114616 RepID=UPI001FCAE017|nr:hypothetical protein [Methylobacterium nodulans]
MWLGFVLSLWMGGAVAQEMHIADYTNTIHQKRFASKDDNDDYMQMLLSASVDNVVRAANRLIERGTADSEALAYAYAQRSNFWKSSSDAWAAAVRDYEHAVQLSTQCKPFYLVRLGEIVAERDWGRAMSYFDQAITLSPQDPYVFFRRGRLYGKAQKNDLALRDFDEVIRLVPHRPAAYIQRAEVWRAAGDIDRALQDYHAAFDRADSQFIKNTQWNLRDKKLYRREPDGSNNDTFRGAVSDCVRDRGCTVVSGWSAETRDDSP